MTKEKAIKKLVIKDAKLDACPKCGELVNQEGVCFKCGK